MYYLTSSIYTSPKSILLHKNLADNSTEIWHMEGSGCWDVIIVGFTDFDSWVDEWFVAGILGGVSCI